MQKVGTTDTKLQRRNKMSDTRKLQEAADGGCPPATCSLCGGAGSFAVAADLLKEVYDSHADPESPEWNDCGTPENDCEWCRMAKEWVSAPPQYDLTPLSEGLVSSACYAVRALKWAHCGKEGWMSEYATNIEIEDEGAGEFLVISQPFANVKLSAGGIAITAEEWPSLRAAIEAAFADISKHNAQADSREE